MSTLERLANWVDAIEQCGWSGSDVEHRFAAERAPKAIVANGDDMDLSCGAAEVGLDKPMKPSPLRNAAHRSEEPEWPDVQHCDCCGADVWAVFDAAGRELTLDVQPLDVELVDGTWRRVGGHVQARELHGYSMPEPQWLNPRRVNHASITSHVEWEPAGWIWSVDRRALAAAGISGQAVYSEHRFTCATSTERQLRAWTGAGIVLSDSGKQTQKPIKDVLVDIVWAGEKQASLRCRNSIVDGNGLKDIVSTKPGKRHCVTVSSKAHPYGREVELSRSQASVGAELEYSERQLARRRRKEATAAHPDDRQLALWAR